MFEPEPSITEQIKDIELAKRLMPIWTDWGIEDSGLFVHSVGVSYLTVLGNHLGYVSASELPAPHSGEYGLTGDNVRSDSIWFDRQKKTPILIAEFERYSGSVADKHKLEGKMQRLLLAQHRWGNKKRHLLLAYWTKGLVSVPDHSLLRSVVLNGFNASASNRVFGANCNLHFLQFVLNESNSSSELVLETIIERAA